MLRLNVVGAGHVGRVLVRLWQEQGVFQLQQLLNRRFESAQAAVAWIGTGQPIKSLDQFEPAEAWLISVPDDQILMIDLPVRSGDWVFHCSGLLSSEILTPLVARGVLVASVHPMNTFSDPDQLIKRFQGTVCAIEGDELVTDFLSHAVEALGGIPFRISKDKKLLYHAMAVFASNYWLSLIEAAFSCGRGAGLTSEHCLQALAPILRQTLENVLNQGPVQALSGPIARGEERAVQAQYEALKRHDPILAQKYKQLGLWTVELAHQGHQAPRVALDHLKVYFERGS